MAISDIPLPSTTPASPSPVSALNADLDAVATSLHRQYDENLGHSQVDVEIRRVADRFGSAKIRAFVPLFVRRYAGATLHHQSRR